MDGFPPGLVLTGGLGGRPLGLLFGGAETGSPTLLFGGCKTRGVAGVAGIGSGAGLAGSLSLVRGDGGISGLFNVGTPVLIVRSFVVTLLGGNAGETSMTGVLGM